MLGIEHPIVLSGMSWISVPKMAAAVSNAGGLGILATGPLDADQTRKAIREIKRLTNKPFGTNATLLFPGASENAQVALEEKVPVINFSGQGRLDRQGSPRVRRQGDRHSGESQACQEGRTTAATPYW